MLKRCIVFVLVVMLLLSTAAPGVARDSGRVLLGNEVLLRTRMDLVRGKRVGLVTNQTGVDGRGRSLVDIFCGTPGDRLGGLVCAGTWD